MQETSATERVREIPNEELEYFCFVINQRNVLNAQRKKLRHHINHAHKMYDKLLSQGCVKRGMFKGASAYDAKLYILSKKAEMRDICVQRSKIVRANNKRLLKFLNTNNLRLSFTADNEINAIYDKDSRSSFHCNRAKIKELADSYAFYKVIFEG